MYRSTSFNTIFGERCDKGFYKSSLNFNIYFTVLGIVVVGCRKKWYTDKCKNLFVYFGMSATWHIDQIVNRLITCINLLVVPVTTVSDGKLHFDVPVI